VRALFLCLLGTSFTNSLSICTLLRSIGSCTFNVRRLHHLCQKDNMAEGPPLLSSQIAGLKFRPAFARFLPCQCCLLYQSASSDFNTMLWKSCLDCLIADLYVYMCPLEGPSLLQSGLLRGLSLCTTHNNNFRLYQTPSTEFQTSAMITRRVCLDDSIEMAEEQETLPDQRTWLSHSVPLYCPFRSRQTNLPLYAILGFA
jgi:hypothetical protein